MSKFDKYDRINSLKATSLFYVLSTESEQFVKSPTLLTVPINTSLLMIFEFEVVRMNMEIVKKRNINKVRACTK